MNGQGKGSEDRVIDREAFRANFDRIEWEGSDMQPGLNVLDPETGKLQPGHVVKDDAHNMKSYSMGIHPDQIPEAELLYGHKGVKFDRDGNAIFRDRAAKLQHLKDRGYHDKNEVRG